MSSAAFFLGASAASFLGAAAVVVRNDPGLTKMVPVPSLSKLGAAAYTVRQLVGTMISAPVNVLCTLLKTMGASHPTVPSNFPSARIITNFAAFGGDGFGGHGFGGGIAALLIWAALDGVIRRASDALSQTCDDGTSILEFTMTNSRLATPFIQVDNISNTLPESPLQ